MAGRRATQLLYMLMWQGQHSNLLTWQGATQQLVDVARRGATQLRVDARRGATQLCVDVVKIQDNGHAH